VGPPARAAIPEIKAVLANEEEHEDVKNAAREALEKIEQKGGQDATERS
jgi:hypothetical protein